MSDFAKQRLNMVDNQVRPSDVTDHTPIAAMLDVPRELFVPSADRPLAYVDRDIRIGGEVGSDRFMLAPAGLARLIQALELDRDAVVLDIGCGTGYSSAILSRLAGSIVAVEEDQDMIRLAEANFSQLEIDNVAVVEARLAEGYPAEGPYDGILLAAGVEVMPSEITDQLADGGRLIAVQYEDGPGRAVIFERSGSTVARRPVFDLSAPVLAGYRREAAFVF